jgi:hypothetical protein
MEHKRSLLCSPEFDTGSNRLISIITILILFSHLRLGFLSSLSTSGFPAIFFSTRLVFSMCSKLPGQLLDRTTLATSDAAYIQTVNLLIGKFYYPLPPSYVQIFSSVSCFKDSSVGIATRLRAGRRWSWGSMPGRGKRLFSPL